MIADTLVSPASTFLTVIPTPPHLGSILEGWWGQGRRTPCSTQGAVICYDQGLEWLKSWPELPLLQTNADIHFVEHLLCADSGLVNRQLGNP